MTASNSLSVAESRSTRSTRKFSAESSGAMLTASSRAAAIDAAESSTPWTSQPIRKRLTRFRPSPHPASKTPHSGGDPALE